MKRDVDDNTQRHTRTLFAGIIRNRLKMASMSAFEGTPDSILIAHELDVIGNEFLQANVRVKTEKYD